MATWIVKFFNRKSNFGFITPDDGEKDVFVHGSNVIGSIADNDRVTYEMGEGRKGPEAKNVTKVEGEEGNVVKMTQEDEEDLPMAA